MMQSISVPLIIWLGIVFIITGCADTNFSSQQNNKPKNVVPKTYQVSNVDADNDADSNLDAEADSKRKKASKRNPDSEQEENDLDHMKKEQRRIEQIFKSDVESVRSAVDVFFVMDTSGSMNNEKAGLEQNMAEFVKKFEEQAKSLDYKIFMIGQGFNFPGTGEKIVKINELVDSVNALTVLTTFFVNKLNDPAILRPDSSKQIIVITDDNAQGVTAPQFKEFINKTNVLKGKTSFNGFVGLNGSAPNCSISRVGSTYIELGRDPEVGGLMIDICRQNWDQLLKELAAKIIKEVAKREFELKQAADTSQEILLFVDGKPVDAKDFTYDEKTRTIKIDKGFTLTDGAEIKVTYMPLAASK